MSHCKVKPGNKIGNYTLTKKLGVGTFSTVWSARTAGDESYAVKIYRSDDADTYENELSILKKVCPAPAIVQYIEAFPHTAGSKIHNCIVMKEESGSLSTLVKYCASKYDSAVPLYLIKILMRDLFRGLEILHSHGIVHGDIKTSNILLHGKIDTTGGLEQRAVLGDLGSSEVVTVRPHRVGTRPYFSPELIAGNSYDTSTDIWSAFVVLYKLITRDRPFDIYDESDVYYGDDVCMDCFVKDPVTVDDQSTAKGTLLDSETPDSETSGSGSSTGEAAEYMVNYKHLLLIAKVIGYPPESFASLARNYYNYYRRLKYHNDMKPITLEELISINYDIDTSNRVAEFIMKGFTYEQDRRITATAARADPWLVSNLEN